MASRSEKRQGGSCGGVKPYAQIDAFAAFFVRDRCGAENAPRSVPQCDVRAVPLAAHFNIDREAAGVR